MKKELFSTKSEPASGRSTPPGSRPVRRTASRGWLALVEPFLVTVTVAVFAWGAWSVIAVPAPLVYDEAVYASHTRSILEGTPDTTWLPHRAPALPAIGTLAYRFTDVYPVTVTDRAFRFVGLSFAVVALLAVRRLARMMAADSPSSQLDMPAGVTALVAMGLFGLAPPVIESAAEFLTDLPAAALLTLAAGVLWREFETRPTPTWGLLAVAPLMAGAFYLRFGSALFVSLLAFVVAVLWWKRILSNPAPAVSTGALLAVLLVPHMVTATTEFGAPWGRVLATSRSVARGMEYPAAGLLEYLDMLPFDLAGPVAGPAMILGAVSGVLALFVSAARRRWTQRERAWAFLVVPAIAHFVLIGLRAHPDVRFLYPAFALLTVAAALLFHRTVGRLGGRLVLRHGDTVAAAVLTVVCAAVTVPIARTATTQVDDRVAHAQKNETVQAVAFEIAEQSEQECFVVASYAAQILWYSACGTARFRNVPPDGLAEAELEVNDERFDTAARWFALFDGGPEQPEDDELEAYLELTTGEPEVAVTGHPSMAWGRAYRAVPAQP